MYSRIHHVPRLLLAALFAIATAVYCGIWIHYIQVLPQSVVGVAFRPFSAERKFLYLVRVVPGSPAAWRHNEDDVTILLVKRTMDSVSSGVPA